MKTPAEAAMDLRWIAPSVASLKLVARSPLASIWTQVRHDPGIVLIHARLMTDPPKSDTSLDIPLLEYVLESLPNTVDGHVDWSQSGAATIHTASCRQAMLASAMAEKLGADTQQAWVAGFLASLGWLAMAAIEPTRDPDTLDKGIEGEANVVARRLCRSWRLPVWLSAVVSHLGLHVSISECLGGDRRLFQIVQLAVLMLQERGVGLPICIGTVAHDLLAGLQLGKDEVSDLVNEVVSAPIPTISGESPAKTPLLSDLLELALESRRQNDAAWIERLQHDIDRMQSALIEHHSQEADRLRTLKLSALAEFAAGAGHEINNPLAVISGQAQYVLKQLDLQDVPAEEIEDIGEYLENLRSQVGPSLNKIIAQTQRVHAILKDLMQFARPQPPKPQTLSVRSLLLEVSSSLKSLADQRRIRITLPEIEHDDYLHADPVHTRIAMTGVLRNAIEAAPAEGWVRVRIDRRSKSMLELIVEDNGSGLTASACEHLFDPFYSGRSAGRGRGLGLPIAWRLARQQGGDVRFDGQNAGITQFVLALPLAPAPLNYAFEQGRDLDAMGQGNGPRILHEARAS